MATNQTTESIKEITIKLSPEQYDLFHKIAQLQDLQDWQLALGCLSSRLDCAVTQAVRELLPMPEESLKNLIESFTDV